MILQFHNLYAQKTKIDFERFSVDQGLNGGPIPYIFQESKGFLWFATWRGLDRYDGYNFFSYQHDPENPASIDDAWLTTLYEDKSGILWAGTWRGLERFDPVTETFTHYTPNPPGPNTEWSNHVTSILEDRTGVLWIGTGDGLNIFNRKTLEFTCFRHDSLNPGSLIYNAVNVIFEDKNGELWFGTGNGLDKFDKKTKQFIQYFSNPNNKNDFGNWGNSSSWITSIYEDEDGIFWLGTFGGLIKFNPRMNKFTLFTHEQNDPKSLGCNKIFAICQDRSDILWISTADYGVDAFNKSTNIFTHYTNDISNPASLSTNKTLSIFSEQSGTIWVGTMDGVNKLNGTKNPFAKLLSENIQSIVNGKNGLIFIATNKELKTFDSKTEKFAHYSSYNEYLITVDNDGNLWTRKPEGGM